MTTPARIQRLLDDRALEAIQVLDADVAALWDKAVRSAQDSRVAQNSPDNQYVLGCQAPLQMGTAILAAAGNRTRGAQGHHANTFYAVAAQKRKLSAYLPGSPTAEQIDQLRKLLDSSLPAARLWLTAARPRAQITPVP